MELGPHTAYILASYAAVALVIALLIAWLVYDGRYQQCRLAELEARGLRRARAADPQQEA